MPHQKPYDNKRQSPSSADHALRRQGERSLDTDGHGSEAPHDSATATQAHGDDLEPRYYLIAMVFGACAVVATYLASTVIAQQKVALISILN